MYMLIGVGVISYYC